MKAGDGGVLAAILPAGMRAISTRIKEETAAGRLILPNDRVDVILTQRRRGRAGSEDSVSDTLFRNIRVLAIGQLIEAKEGKKLAEGNTATLELTPAQAEELSAANAKGEISLSLRSIADMQKRDEATLRRSAAIRSRCSSTECGRGRMASTSVMIEKFATARGRGRSEFLDLNHTSKSLILVSLMIAKFARDAAAKVGELRNRDTSAPSKAGRKVGNVGYGAARGCNRKIRERRKHYCATAARADNRHAQPGRLLRSAHEQAGFFHDRERPGIRA